MKIREVITEDVAMVEWLQSKQSTMYNQILNKVKQYSDEQLVPMLKTAVNKMVSDGINLEREYKKYTVYHDPTGLSAAYYEVDEPVRESSTDQALLLQRYVEPVRVSVMYIYAILAEIQRRKLESSLDHPVDFYMTLVKNANKTTHSYTGKTVIPKTGGFFSNLASRLEFK